MFGAVDYYLGWVIQPLDPLDQSYYVYERGDTYRPRGYTIRGPRYNCWAFINERIEQDKKYPRG